MTIAPDTSVISELYDLFLSCDIVCFFIFIFLFVGADGYRVLVHSIHPNYIHTYIPTA